jgi:hypothetical protein
VRASETERGLLCPASLVLPRTRERSARADDAADFGTLVHAWKETGEIQAWGSRAHRTALRRKLLASRTRRAGWWPAALGHHEVTFAIDVFNAAYFTYNGPRSEANAWKERFDPRKFLTGTIDWLGHGEDGAPWVDDLKTGRRRVDPGCKQLMSYALYPWLRDGAPIEWSCHRSITWWPRYPMHRGPRRHFAQPLTGVEAAAHFVALRHALERGEAFRTGARTPEEINPTEEGCRFCDCQPSCPAHVAPGTDTDNPQPQT